jgi:hypothetical protein
MSTTCTKEARKLAVAYAAFLEANAKSDLPAFVVWARQLARAQLATGIVLIPPENLTRYISTAETVIAGATA